MRYMKAAAEDRVAARAKEGAAGAGEYEKVMMVMRWRRLRDAVQALTHRSIDLLTSARHEVSERLVVDDAGGHCLADSGSDHLAVTDLQ